MSHGFKIKIQLPSGKRTRLEELKNRDYLTILKYCENADAEGLNEFFNILIFKNELKFLDIIDKFYILLTIRMLFIDPDLIFSNKGSSVNYGISTILEKIDCFQNDFEKTITAQDFTVDLGLPNIIYFRSIDDIYASIIRTITLKGKVLNFAELTEDEKEGVLASIPNLLFPYINKYITQISNQLQDFVIIEQNEAFNIEGINTSIISNEFMSFIMMIFSTGLKNFFELLYVFSNRLSIPGNTFFDLTPLDTRVLINIYNKDIDDQNKELQSKKRE